jgi:ferredoxin
MEHLTIDQKRCIKCNRCVQDCPMGIPEVAASGNYFCNENNAEVCIYCGHCVAVCPTNAITLHAMKNPENLAEMSDYGIIPFDLTPEDCAPTEIQNAASVQSMEALIKSRRMTRSFKKDMVDHEIIRHIIQDLLIYAPSGHNTRGHKALVVEGRDKLEKLT